VNESGIRRTVADLEGFSTRYDGTEGNVRAGTYLHERLDTLPALSVRYQDDRFRNVLGTLRERDPLLMRWSLSVPTMTASRRIRSRLRGH